MKLALKWFAPITLTKKVTFSELNHLGRILIGCRRCSVK